jgi:parallel beta-helix repeat protein
LIEDNLVEDVTEPGIFWEASRNGIIRNNTVLRCGTGIFISASYGTDTYNNTVENCFRGIQYFLDCSRLTQVDLFVLDLRDNDTYNNAITIPSTAGALGNTLFLGNASGAQITTYTTSKNLHYEGNTYNTPSPTVKYWVWGNVNKTFAEWNALGHDDTGTWTPGVEPPGSGTGLYSINFNSGVSLATLGFVDIDPTVANVAGVGVDGSYAMSWQSGDDLTRCRYPFEETSEACFSGVWIPKVYTDWSLFAVLFFNGTSYVTAVQLYTDSSTRELFLEHNFGDEVWRSAANFITIDVSIYWRLYVKASSVNGTPDGEITLWTGASAGALTQQYASTDRLVFRGWNFAGFGPMGVLDDLAATVGTCGISVVPPSDDGGDIGVPCAPSAQNPPPEGGGDTGVIPDPVGELPPWSAECSGLGQVENVADIGAGEAF